MLAVCVAGLAVTSQLHARSWQAGYETGRWQATEPSPLNCELVHEVPNFGMVRFIHRAGETLRVQFDAYRHAFRAGNLQLVALAPAWQPGMDTWQIGQHQYRNIDEPIRLGTREAELFLESLHQGRLPSIIQQDTDARVERRRASLTPVAFRQAFNDFAVCRNGLLNFNFDQLQLSRISFQPGGAQLTDADRALLDKIVIYAGADPEVELVLVDGHTDTSGTRQANRELSARRTQAVVDYLTRRGMPESMIRHQYHGQRYPIADNRTAEGRALNRRVMIQLERTAEAERLF